MQDRLDLKDQRLLHAIEFDARSSISKLAKKAILSKEVANYRLKKLEKESLIDCYQTVFNLYSIGKDSYFILFKIQDFHNKQKQILDSVAKIKHCSRIILTDGDWSLILAMQADSLFEITENLQDFLDTCGDLVEHKSIIFLKEQYMSRYSFLYPDIETDRNEVIHIKQHPDKKFQLTDLQKEITYALAREPRISLQNLAKKLEIDVKTLKKHIEKLKEDGFIVLYRTCLNPEKMNFKRFMVFVSFKNMSNENREITEYLLQSKHVSSIYHSFGDADLIFDVWFSDLTHFFDFMRELSIEYSSSIKKYSFAPIAKYNRKPY